MSRARRVAAAATLDMGSHSGWTGCMNNQEATMHDSRFTNRFQVLDNATEAAGLAISIAMRVPAPLKPIADQVIRSASSVPANLAEGHGRSGRDRLHHYRIAYASAKEVDVHLRILCVSHPTHRDQATNASLLFDDVRAVTWRLVQPRP
jgi:four helix bundle protein